LPVKESLRYVDYLIADRQIVRRACNNAPASGPAITGEIKEIRDRGLQQKSPNLSAQEVTVSPEAVPEPRRGWKWILAGAVRLLIVVGAVIIARRLDSYAKQAQTYAHLEVRDRPV
jgi:hypothetical protein